MKTYHLEFSQTLPISIKEAWDFFSSPKNLQKITPAKMGFKIVFQSGGDKMYAGQIIQYKINILPFLKSSWLTEITHVNEPHAFVDEQRQGPYAMWHHQHRFEETHNGIVMHDILTYRVPFWFFGDLLNKLFIHREINRIFEYRRNMLKEYFIK